MYKIQANQSGTRSIEVSDQHLETIDKYQLLRNLVDSNGDLCLDVIYNQNMKALGLHNLVLLYVDWKDKKDAQAAAEAEPDAVND